MRMPMERIKLQDDANMNEYNEAIAVRDWEILSVTS